ncbi:MAG: hypothetical protein NVS1B11_29670 [Terriglobales bacterium]
MLRSLVSPLAPKEPPLALIETGTFAGTLTPERRSDSGSGMDTGGYHISAIGKLKLCFTMNGWQEGAILGASD